MRRAQVAPGQQSAGLTSAVQGREGLALARSQCVWMGLQPEGLCFVHIHTAGWVRGAAPLHVALQSQMSQLPSPQPLQAREGGGPLAAPPLPADSPRWLLGTCPSWAPVPWPAGQWLPLLLVPAEVQGHPGPPALPRSPTAGGQRQPMRPELPGTQGAGRRPRGCRGGAGRPGGALQPPPGPGAPASSRTDVVCPCRSGAS